ncbi:hypothetical protein B7463_g4642, partial [Scytalidium lignicola]
MVQSQGEAAQQAQKACMSCYLRKRKCDKTIPSCSTCATHDWVCDYSRQPITQQTEQAFRQQQNNDANKYLPRTHDTRVDLLNIRRSAFQQLDFPAAFFLDQNFFQQYRIQVPRAHLATSLFPFHLLGDHIAINAIVSKFFNTSHKWLPVIHETKLRSSLKQPLGIRADVALLLLSMKLLISSPQESGGNTQTEVYLATKHCLTDAEIAGVLSTEALTAALFISFYEVGHAIYPAAFLSIATCVRHGYALGLGLKQVPQIDRPFNRDELEERWRIWRAILLFDRFVNLGCPRRPFAALESNSDIGKPPIAPEEMIASNSSYLSRRDTGCFVLISESTDLLGQVLDCVSWQDDIRQQHQLEERIVQLDRTINSLITAAEVEAKKWNVPINNELAISYSAMMILHESYPWLDQQSLASIKEEHQNGAMKPILDKIMLMCKNWLSDPPSVVETTSPLVHHCIYYAIINIRKYSQIMEDERATEEVKSLTTMLRIFSQRWKAADAYLQILEAREIGGMWP